MYRENLREFVNLCRLGRVPLTSDAQDRLLRAIRFTLWNRKHEELQALLMACGMGESEIVERKRFYLKFAAMVGRMVVLIPHLHQLLMLDYIAEDMIDGGDPELAAAGERFNVILGHAKAGAQGVKGQITMPPFQVFPPERLAFYQSHPADLIIDFIEPNWEYDSDRSYGLAAAVELLSLEDADRSSIAPILIKSLGDFSSSEQFFAAFGGTTANLLKKAGYDEWANILYQVFAPLAGASAENPSQASASGPISGNGGQHAESAYGPLALAAISDTWKREGIERALPLARQRLLMTPEDPHANGMLGNIYLERMNVPQALACLSRAYWRDPDSPVVIFVLGQAFQAGYFAPQVDLCREKLKQLPACQANPEQYRFGVELFLKCDEPETQVFINGRPMGPCPVQVRNVRPCSLQILWKLKNGREKSLAVDLQDATVAKYRYHPDSGQVSDEISRDGAVTVFTASGTRELADLVGEYLVNDLSRLPNPTVDKCLEE